MAGLGGCLSNMINQMEVVDMQQARNTVGPYFPKHKTTDYHTEHVVFAVRIMWMWIIIPNLHFQGY